VISARFWKHSTRGRVTDPAGHLRCLPNPTCHELLIELVVLVDLEIAHFLVCGLTEREEAMRCRGACARSVGAPDQMGDGRAPPDVRQPRLLHELSDSAAGDNVSANSRQHVEHPLPIGGGCRGQSLNDLNSKGRCCDSGTDQRMH
jgi:hypothetical protein